MKKTVLFTILFAFATIKSFSQISVVSTNGYSVNINVQPVAIVTGGGSCQWGYEYYVKLNYIINFTGSNIPSSLYTLQGTVASASQGAIFFDLPNNGGNGNVLASRAYRNASDCATATPAKLGFNTLNIQIEGPGISSRTVSFPYSNVLPIQLVNFSADLSVNTVKIKWTTASEINNASFTIERSTDGTQWAAIKTVKGAGNSSDVRNYETTDEAPVAGISYYRLKQTDIDGKSTISDIKTVKYTTTNKAISLFPVPNTGNTVNIAGITDYKNNDFALVNISGNIVFSTTLSKASVELPSVPAGVYFIRINNKVSGEATNLRYVKM